MFFCSNITKWRPQSRYNRGSLRPIIDMDFQFLAKWAAQEVGDFLQIFEAFSENLNMHVAKN